MNNTNNNKMKTAEDFQIGQIVTYNVCASQFTGTIVKIKSRSLIIIDCKEGMILWNAGVSCGDEVAFEQVVSI